MIKLSTLLILAAVPGAAVAQEAIQPASAKLALRQIVLAPNTEVVVTPNDTITTKGRQVKEGFKFRFSTVFDVMQDGVVVIPKGTPGEGTVTWMTSKAVFGKSGKMEVSFDWLELGGRRVSLTGRHREEGDGNTGATIGAVVAVGVLGGLVVTGHSATVANGQTLRARLAEALTFEIPVNAPQVVTGRLAAAPGVATPALRPEVVSRMAGTRRMIQLVPEGTIPPAVIDLPAMR